MSSTRAADLAELTALASRITEQMGQLKGTGSPSATDSPCATGTPPGAPRTPAEVHGPRVSVPRSASMTSAVPGSQRHLEDLVGRFTARTARSKALARRYRPVLADSRATVGFRSATKEMLYPLAASHAQGAHLTDIDGNEYVDITMGFGTLLFGHEPSFLSEAVREHLSAGLRLGPRGPETGEAARLLAELTGMERVAFATSGTEANASAVRLARAATGRSKIVVFHGAYHGHADATLGRTVGRGPQRRTVPVSPGVPDSAMTDLIMLDYGAPQSLDVIAEHADDIAVVMVEPVQSRNPALQPVEFVGQLRELTARTGIVLLFDEMLTGLRPHPRGAQELYGVVPDLATYGKLLGGGFPIGAVAGGAELLDGVDGGQWQYGDDSFPERETTFFGGTYIQHPLAMTAACAVLRHLSEQGPQLQDALNARTQRLTDGLNRFFQEEQFPLTAARYGSMFRFEHRADMELLYHHLLLRGVYVWEWRNFFLSTAHTDDDITFVEEAVTDSLRELRQAGFFPRRPARAPAHASARTAAAAPAGPEPQPSSQPQPKSQPRPRREATAEPKRAPDMSLYFFGDYPEQDSAADAYDTLTQAARFADRQGFHALWLPERHFHSFGGIFPNPSVLAAALATATERIRLNAGSVVLPLHDPVRVAEEWSVVDNLSRGRVGLGCAAGWNARDFVFFPERFGTHRELMYEQAEQIRALWKGGPLRREGGDGETEVRLFPRPFQQDLPMYTAIVGNPDSYRMAGHHDLGVVTNLMGQTPEQLAENIALYRRARTERGLDPDGGRVAVLLHTFLSQDHAEARAAAYRPLFRYMRSSLSLFGQMTSSLGRRVDVGALSEDDLDAVFSRAYERYCDQRALIGSPQTCLSVVDTLREAGVDEVAALLDFGVPSRTLLDGLPHLDGLRAALHGERQSPAAGAGARSEARCEAGAAAASPLRGEVRLTTTLPAEETAAGPEGSPAATANSPAKDATSSLRPAHGGSSDAEPDAGGEASGGAPLSPGQRRIWIQERVLPRRSAYNEPAAVALDGPLDTDALRTALGELIARHEALRTVFRTTPQGEPRQHVLAPGTPELPVLERPDSTEEEAVREAMAAESEHRFDLAEGPLFHARLLRLAEERHVLVLSFHHIVVDAVSAGILTRDLSALYRAARSGTAARLPELPLTYRDFSTRQLVRATEEPDASAEEDLAYWRTALGGGLPVLELPADRPRPKTPSAKGRSLHRTLPNELLAGLRQLSRRCRSTLFMTLLSGYAAMLAEVSGQRDLVIGTPISDRPEGTEDVVGFFVNTLALRVDLSDDPAFEQLLGRVRGVALDAYDHAGVPFDTVVKAVAPPRHDTSRNPVFQVMAEYEEGEPLSLDLPGVTARTAAIGADKALVDLSVYFTVTGEGVSCRFEYTTDLFEEETVAGFFEVFERILRTAVAPTPAAEVPSAEVPSAEGPSAAVAETTVHELVARQVRTGPGRPAVRAPDGSLTYGELGARAERLAAVLRDLPDEDGSPVAIWLPRSTGLVVAMLAVLESGRPYLPLDPALGPQRVASVLADSGARTVLTGAQSPPLPPLPAGVAQLDVPPGAATPAAGPREGEATHSPGGEARLPAAARQFCLIYTSGSEGRPKGIALSHRGMVNLAQWQHRRFGTGTGTRSAAVCSQSFDASLLEIWPALTGGGTVVVADEEVRLDPRALSRWYAREGITFTMLPTALAEQLMVLPPQPHSRLRHLVCGGEQLARRPHPEAPYETVNVYGPGEITVLATEYTVAPHAHGDGPIPIGYPIDNTRLYVLDGDGRPVPPGTPGELHIDGPGVALGYHRDPRRTSDRFTRTPGGLRYRTGDLVEQNADGALVFRGRLDEQVKISGFRVEPGEPARVLLTLPGVRDGAVIARRDPRRGARLVGYAVPEAGACADPTSYLAGLEKQLAAELPHYLVPREWAVLEELPLNVNGKLDRSALPPGRVPASAEATAGDAGAESGRADRAETDPADEGRAGRVPAAAGPEAKLRELWEEALGTGGSGQVADETSFFTLGGDSLGAIRLTSLVSEEFAVEYPVVRFFEEPTLKAMAAYLSGRDERVQGEV